MTQLNPAVSSKNWKSSIADHLAVAAGAMLGVSLRWFISMPLNTNAYFPFGTLTVNLIGCFLIGYAHTWLRTYPAPRVKLGLIVGLLGSFTTFSTFSIETVQLLQTQQLSVALIYQGLSIGAGLGAVVLGTAIMQMVIRRKIEEQLK